jgi:hypothetical protein
MTVDSRGLSGAGSARARKIYGIKYRRTEGENKMVDPTSDVAEDISEEEAPDCATCGATVLDTPRHRVVTWVEDGEVRTAHFCDDDCRMEWDGSVES